MFKGALNAATAIYNMGKQLILNLKKATAGIDWKLLLFLVLFLNIKLPVKLFAIVLIYLLRPNFKFQFRLSNSRLPVFYLLIISIAFIGLLINRGYPNSNYLLLFFTGIGFWLLCMLAMHQVKLATEQSLPDVIHRTLTLFFIINAAISLLNLLYIMWITGTINPYTFRGMYQAYFINTGDNIMGITFDISSTNAVLCGLGAIYFISRQNILMMCVCVCTMLLTYSNLITAMWLLVLILLFVVKSTRLQKSMIVVCLGLYLVFMAKVSPQNKNYVTQSAQNIVHKKHPHPESDSVAKLAIPLIKRPDSLLSPDEKRQKIALLYLDSVHHTQKKRLMAYSIPVNSNGRIDIPAPDTISEHSYLSKEMEPDRKLMLDFIGTHTASLPLSAQSDYAPALPGKITGMLQSVNFLRRHPVMLIAGSGIGNFSSKIAFRAVGLGMRGKYPQNHIYINNDFLSNHLDLYLSFFSKTVAYRSVVNNPFSVYDQLLTEYGVLGFMAFLLCYLGYFARRYKQLTYGLPMLLFVAGICFIDYWFEQLSVMILFELMMFLNLKENQTLNQPAHAN